MKKDKRILIPKDEFEEEASEGLGRLSREEAEADLRELKARMERRVARPRSIWLPAAAAVIILLVASGLVITLLRQQPPGLPELALTEETIKDTAYIAMAGPIEKDDYALAAKGSTTKYIAALEAETSDVLEIMDKADTGYEYQADVPVAAVPVKEDPVVTLIVDEEEMAEEVVVRAIPEARAAAVKARAATETREVVEARDEKKAAAVRTVAAKDLTGKAEPAAAKPVAEKTEPAAAKPVAEKTEPAAGEAEPAIYAPPIPLGGWESFVEWTARNIRYPEGVEPVVRQEVTVSFMVQADSTISDLRMLNSPGESFTREAFRLLREGPKWVPGSGGGKATGEAVTVKIVFK